MVPNRNLRRTNVRRNLYSAYYSRQCDMPLSRYSIPNRLADVLALIQVLALDQFAHRTEAGLQEELQGRPRSGANWTTVALEHPEFFRVDVANDHPISLVARHATPGGQRPPLDASFIGKLTETAIHLHDREENRRAIWRSAGLPFLSVLLGGALSIAASYFSAMFHVQSQVTLQEDREARTVYSRLVGSKAVIRQLRFSHAEAFLNTKYHEAKWILSGASQSSVDLQEAQRWKHKSADLVSEIVKANQSLYTDIGTVLERFPATIRLQKLADRVLNSRGIKSLLVPRVKDPAELERWREKTLGDLDAFVESEYVKPLEDFIQEVQQELHRG